MEHDGNISARASTDERACPSTAGQLSAQPPDTLQFATQAQADAWWAGVNHGLRCATGENGREDEQAPAPCGSGGEPAQSLDPSAPGLRHDGWLPWKKAQFLLLLAAGGVVADACAAVGMSVASAYALKNRPSGRAFGKMWDAVMIHRARARLADNNLSRAMNGCVEQVLKDGVVVAERRRFDNRLSMAMLTRLDRLAESRSDEEAALLRALSEQFDGYLDVLGSGGDEQAFLEASRPPKPDEKMQAGREALATDDRDGRALPAGPRDWSLVDPAEIPVDGLDLNRMHEWTAEQRQRAELSHYLDWFEEMAAGDEPMPYGYQCPAAFDRYRRDLRAAAMASPDESGASQPSTSSTSRIARRGRKRPRGLK